MNRASRSVKKTSPGSEEFDPKRVRKKKLSPRNPFKDLNNINISSNSSSSLSIDAPRGCLSFFLSNSSSKTPLQRPRNLPKTPKSLSNHGPSQCRPKPATKQRSNGGAISENLEKPKRTPCLYQWQNGKKRSFGATRRPKSSSDSEGHGSSCNELVSEVCLKEEAVDTGETSNPRLFSAKVDLEEHGTPVNKVAVGTGLDSRPGKVIEENSSTTNTTPPVQASISPEIQCGSSLVSTPSCFGAGHVLSGVTDKRKCRPRGVLTVGEDTDFFKAGGFDGADHDNAVGLFNSCRVSLVPAPTEASVHWLLPPRDGEELDHMGSSRKGSPESGRMKVFSTFQSPSSSSSANGFSSDVCNISESASTPTTATTSTRGRRRPSSVSPIEFPEFGGFFGPISSVSRKRHSSDHAIGCSSSCRPVPCVSDSKDHLPPQESGHRYDGEKDNSPFSWDSVGSGNVICTPQSDSSSYRRYGLSCLDGDSHREHQLGFDTTVDILHNTHLSPQSQISMWDAAEIPSLPALSAHFSQPVTPLNSVDWAQLWKPLHDFGVGFSCSSFENSLQLQSLSRLRISWRDGLVSRIFEMEEPDCCRGLSDDEEEEVSYCGSSHIKSDLNYEHSQTERDDVTLNDGFKHLESAYEEPACNRENKVEIPPERPNVCAESISTEGGGLVASNDSDWSCFKNQLFKV
ncbi:hypothetical protein NE237_015859 [Protea cynaroides]|uniref:Uncharacterized protein n=1 Tax=Protea cynaroides TaxID=273540 RepID=A0A9Q0KEL5_9MAGN|nr:hypothetical protein NE237_015859 [Protea cynaroides]